MHKCTIKHRVPLFSPKNSRELQQKYLHASFGEERRISVVLYPTMRTLHNSSVTGENDSNVFHISLEFDEKH